MKFRTLNSLVLAAWLLANAATFRLFAQEHGQHHHYKLIDLSTLGGPQSFQLEETPSPLAAAGPAVRLINSHGAVTGVADLNMADPFAFCLSCDGFLAHAFLWIDGSMTDLGSLPGTQDTFPGWINESGDVVGASYNGVDPVSGTPFLEAVLWKDGTVVDLGDLPGGNQSIANGINARGDVVGASVNTTPDLVRISGEFSFSTSSLKPVRFSGGMEQSQTWERLAGLTARRSLSTMPGRSLASPSPTRP